MAKIKCIHFALILVLCLFISGCTKYVDRYVDRPVYIEVPIMVKPEIDKVEKPDFPINYLTENATPAEVAEAYYRTILIYKKYTEVLEESLQPFQNKN